MNKQLTKSTTDKQIAGVAGGIAQYFDVDPTLVRLAFVLFTFLGGPGLILYIIMAIVLPEEESWTETYTEEKPKSMYVG